MALKCKICGQPALYNRCEAHYQCDECGSRENLCHREGGVTCDACHAAKIAERMKQEHDTQYTNEIKCPYCGYEWSDSWEMGNGDTEECPDCLNTFEYEMDVVVTYISWKKDERT